ncbi:hypothetical protein LXD69_13250 [Flavobacterium sediminilitoris]|uniref:Uncharacterized protein n=1 Tax=Flavobacterium sediminilitoris TaxID=2024526 RepID=A0ABY4HJH1_9FLAO|nr:MULTISPECIES: hypothetical protein [Flavobacterium]UOX33000.1 hypothetical protein LXD69_13250 [Flavobacterium sediminilitoris]
MFSLYFDPGTGALIVQFIVGAIAGITLFYKTLITKIKSFFGVKNHGNDDFMDETEDNK